MTDLKINPDSHGWIQFDAMMPAPIAEAIIEMLRDVGGWQTHRAGPEPVLTLTLPDADGAYLEWHYVPASYADYEQQA